MPKVYDGKTVVMTEEEFAKKIGFDGYRAESVYLASDYEDEKVENIGKLIIRLVKIKEDKNGK